MFGGSKKGPGTGISARLQMYVVVMGGYYLYKTYYMPPDAGKTGAGANSGSQDDDCKGRNASLRRRFKQVDGLWLSSMEAGGCADMLLMLLHQTSSSAETEFGKVIPQLQKKAAPSGGLQVVALDRPCHGYSACPEGGEPATALDLFLGRRPAKQQIAFMTTGRASARQMLATVQRRKTASRMLLVRPQLVAPDAKVASSVLAAADSARWSVLVGDSPSSKETGRLDVASIPLGCTVTLVYIEGDQEDEDLKTALEERDAMVEVRLALDGEALEETVLLAATDMLAGDGAATADASEEEV